MAKIKGWKLEYYVHNVPQWLRNNPIGNFRGALELDAKVIGMNEIDTSLHPADYIKQARKPDDKCLVLPEAGVQNYLRMASSNWPMNY
ncbi:pyridoxal phosphate-dependent deaminase putative [Vibrio astriarenae]|nr:pyridoxal phosphate-dependent deaminase putative [Vibrio sp. C7]